MDDNRSLRKNRIIAFLLSLFQPGFGQLYAGCFRRGCVLCGVFIVASILALGGFLGRSFAGGLVAVALLLGIRLASALDAARVAHTPTRPRAVWQRWYIAFAFALLFQVALGFALPIFQNLKSYRIPSGTMEPTLQVGDHLVAALDAFDRALPARNDLAIFQSPEQPASELVKRIVAIPGDVVEIRDKALYINDRQVPEPWVVHRDQHTFSGVDLPPAAARRDQFPATVVPPGHVFVLGDNRDVSYDSRYFGAVPVSSLVGKPLYIYWPIARGRMGTPLDRW